MMLGFGLEGWDIQDCGLIRDFSMIYGSRLSPADLSSMAAFRGWR